MKLNKQKVVFFGTPAFSVPSLQACLDSAHVVGVVTQPDRPRGRGQKVSPCEVKELALKNQIPVFSPERLSEKGGDAAQELYGFLLNAQPNLFVVTAYGNLLPKKYLDLPKTGCFNVHASLLPKWRGAAPIQRAIEAGDTETGVCLQKMVEELDAGDILFERKTPILNEDNSLTLFKKLSELGYDLIAQLIQECDNQKPLQFRKQDPSAVSIAKKINKEEGFWTIEWSAFEAFNKVRAFIAWPGTRAHVPEIGIDLIIEEVKISHDWKLTSKDQVVRAGEIKIINNKALIYCNVRAGEPNSTCLEIVRIKVPNRGSTGGYEYFKNEFKKHSVQNFTVQSPKNRGISL